MQLASPGLFGKIPAQGDFLRINAGAPIVGVLDRWLQEGIEALRRAGGAPPAGPLHFVFRAQGVRQVLIGTMLPSRDSVGREFPLVLFAQMDGKDACRGFPLIPSACASFFAASTDLLEDAARLQPQELPRRLADLPALGAEDISSADQTMRAALRGATTGDLVGRLFASEPPGRHYYGFATLLSACAPARGRDTDQAGVTLDCPVRSPIDRMLWLELTRRLLGWIECPPSILWSDPPDAHLLISLGPAPMMMLRYLIGSEPGSTRLWPLNSDRADAIHQAYGTLGARNQQALARADLSLEALLTTLASP